MKPLLLSAALVAWLSIPTFAQAPAAAPHKDVTPDEAQKLIESNKDLVVIDVRTPEEFKAGHIAGAKNVSLLDADFDQKIKEYQGKPILLHCASGSRSARALTKMADLRVPEIYHMNGGMKAWQSAGKAVVKDAPAPQ
jgi:rhodanese-related sulfurtransferase